MLTPCLRRVGQIAFAGLGFACAPTETGNPVHDDDTITIALSAGSSSPDAVALGESRGGLGVETVWLRVVDIGIDRCGAPAARPWTPRTEGCPG